MLQCRLACIIAVLCWHYTAHLSGYRQRLHYIRARLAGVLLGCRGRAYQRQCKPICQLIAPVRVWLRSNYLSAQLPRLDETHIFLGFLRLSFQA